MLSRADIRNASYEIIKIIFIFEYLVHLFVTLLSSYNHLQLFRDYLDT